MDDFEYIDDNSGQLYSFITGYENIIYTTLTKDLGLHKEFHRSFTGDLGDVNFNIGMYAGFSAPLLFNLQTNKYLVPDQEIISRAFVTPQEGFARAELYGQASIYGYDIPLINPEIKSIPVPPFISFS